MQLPSTFFETTINPQGKWCPEPESNQRHEDFQSSALPTELSGPKYIFKLSTIQQLQIQWYDHTKP